MMNVPGMNEEMAAWLRANGVNPSLYCDSANLSIDDRAVHVEAWEVARAESSAFNGAADGCQEAMTADELRQALAALPDDSDRLAFIRSLAYRHRAQALEEEDRPAKTWAERTEAASIKDCVDAIHELGGDGYVMAFLGELKRYRMLKQKAIAPLMQAQLPQAALQHALPGAMPLALTAEETDAEAYYIGCLKDARAAATLTAALSCLLDADEALDDAALRSRSDLRARLNQTTELIRMRWDAT